MIVYLNYDANNHVANAIHILKQLPRTGEYVPAAIAYD